MKKIKCPYTSLCFTIKCLLLVDKRLSANKRNLARSPVSKMSDIMCSLVLLAKPRKWTFENTAHAQSSLSKTLIITERL